MRNAVETLDRAINEASEILLAQVRACNPVTVNEATRELRTQSVEWCKLSDMDKDSALTFAVNELIAAGKIWLEIDAIDGTIRFNLPA